MTGIGKKNCDWPVLSRLLLANLEKLEKLGAVVPMLPVMKKGGNLGNPTVEFGKRMGIGCAPRARGTGITPWCNGSTTGFGPVSQGSSPCGVAIFWQIEWG